MYQLSPGPQQRGYNSKSIGKEEWGKEKRESERKEKEREKERERESREKNSSLMITGYRVAGVAPTTTLFYRYRGVAAAY